MSKREKITKLRVKNYKSLKDIEVELDDLTVLVGLNGAGKSNVIDTLRFTIDALTKGLDSAITMRHGMSAIRRWSYKGRPYDVTTEIHFHSPPFTGNYGFTIGSAQRTKYGIKNEICNIKNYKTQEEFILKRDIKRDKREGTIEVMKKGKERARVNIVWGDEELALPFAARLPIEKKIINVDPFKKVYRLFLHISFYTIFPNVLREPKPPGREYPLDEHGDNLASVLRNLKAHDYAGFFKELKVALGAVVPGIVGIEVLPIGGYLVVKLRHMKPRNQKQEPLFELFHESDGTLRLLGLSVALYQYPSRSLITIEEPELTIHPGALGVLADLLMEAKERSQILITTHSPDLLSLFPAENLRIVEMVEGETKIGKIDETQKEIIKGKLLSTGNLFRAEGLRRQNREE